MLLSKWIIGLAIRSTTVAIHFALQLEVRIRQIADRLKTTKPESRVCTGEKTEARSLPSLWWADAAFVLAVSQHRKRQR